MKEQFSRLGKSAASNIFSYFSYFCTRFDWSTQRVEEFDGHAALKGIRFQRYYPSFFFCHQSIYCLTRAYSRSRCCFTTKFSDFSCRHLLSLALTVTPFPVAQFICLLAYEYKYLKQFLYYSHCFQFAWLLSYLHDLPCGAWPHTVILRSYNNSSSGVNLTPYSGVIFRGVILTPKRSLKNSFSGIKMTPDIEELK